MSASNKFVLNWTGAAPSPISEMEKAEKKLVKLNYRAKNLLVSFASNL